LPFITITPSCSGPNPPQATATGIQLVTNSWRPTSQTVPRFSSKAGAFFASLQGRAMLALVLALIGVVIGLAVPRRSSARLIVYLIGGYALATLSGGTARWDVSTEIGLQLAWAGCALLSCEAFVRIVKHRSPDPLPAGFTPAPLRKRLAAWIIDLMVVAAIAAALITGIHPPVAPMFVVLAIAAAYWIGQQAFRGATLGQHLLGLSTANAAGQQITLPRAALRFAAWPVSILFFFGLGTIITLRQNGRTLQDTITNTRILDTSPPPPHQEPPQGDPTASLRETDGGRVA
jgi:uncharacterized RDD family membrane protein YckC